MEETRDHLVVDDENDSTQTFEINLEDPSASDVDGVIEEAVAAVDSAAARSSGGRTEGMGSVTKIDAAGDEVAQLRSESQSLKERLMRTLADFENFRKRTDREKEALRRFAIFDVVKDFLGVVDNLERAMAAAGSTDDLKQGLLMVLRQQQDVLKRYGVEPIEAEGKAFDPSVHEAVMREESEDVEVPTVRQEFQKGYLLHDRLLRPSMVTVAVPRSTDAESDGPADAEIEARVVEEETGSTKD